MLCRKEASKVMNQALGEIICTWRISSVRIDWIHFAKENVLNVHELRILNYHECNRTTLWKTPRAALYSYSNTNEMTTSLLFSSSLSIVEMHDTHRTFSDFRSLGTRLSWVVLHGFLIASIHLFTKKHTTCLSCQQKFGHFKGGDVACPSTSIYFLCCSSKKKVAS